MLRSAKTTPVRTFKLAKRRTLSPASISLMFGSVAALALPAMWWLSEDAPIPPPSRPRLHDVKLQWRCEAGHTFEAYGQIGSQKCHVSSCRKRAYPVARYVCPVHGEYQAMVRFTRKNGETRKEALRLIGRQWVPAEEGLHCPICNRRLVYKPLTPLDRARLKIEREGG